MQYKNVPQPILETVTSRRNVPNAGISSGLTEVGHFPAESFETGFYGPIFVRFARGPSQAEEWEQGVE